MNSIYEIKSFYCNSEKEKVDYHELCDYIKKNFEPDFRIWKKDLKMKRYPVHEELRDVFQYCIFPNSTSENFLLKILKNDATKQYYFYYDVKNEDFEEDYNVYLAGSNIMNKLYHVIYNFCEKNFESFEVEISYDIEYWREPYAKNYN